jgi:hypothetical protein
MIKLLHCLLITCISLLLPSVALSQQIELSQNDNAKEAPAYPKWKRITPGLEYSKMLLPSSGSFVKSELYILKIDPHFVSISGAHAPTHLGRKRGSVKSMVKKKQALAGINANFFDKKNDTLGVLIIDTEMLSPLHKGGKLLSGIFQIKQNVPDIISRNDFSPEMVTLAVQSGPRLIVTSEKSHIRTQEPRSRRSGIAITDNNSIILFATKLRFPGATLEEVQHTLLNSDLGIRTALNLDGGGSSQLYFYEDEERTKEISISGGDDVTAALLVLRKETH